MHQIKQKQAKAFPFIGYYTSIAYMLKLRWDIDVKRKYTVLLGAEYSMQMWYGIFIGLSLLLIV